MLEYLRQQLKLLAERRAALKAELEGVLAPAQAESRAPNDDERKAFDAKAGELRKLDEGITSMQAQITELTDGEQRAKAAGDILAEAGQVGHKREGGARVTHEPSTYRKDVREYSYFLDLARSKIRGDGEAAERLTRHGKEINAELPRREQLREQRAQRELEGIEGYDRWNARQREKVFEQRVAPNTTDGQGGYFVPPLWLIDEYIDLLRFGRTTANLCRTLTLPGGTNSINIPKISTGTVTGVQAGEGAPVASQDLTDEFVTAPVRTIAGMEDTSMQVLDQSPAGFDQIIFNDLIEDYNARLDVQVIDGSGTAGQHLGILNVTGINAITYTDADPTLPEMYVPIAKAASKVFTGRKLPATGAVLYPPTWYWATAQVDTTNRPLIVPPTVAWNPVGTQNTLAGEDGPAGMLSMGVPAWLDGNLPATKGAGANETRTIVARFPDLYLWEGPLRSRVMTEVLSGTLQVRFQVWAYSAFMPHRRPTSISVISGTGMIPPSGY